MKKKQPTKQADQKKLSQSEFDEILKSILVTPPEPKKKNHKPTSS